MISRFIKCRRLILVGVLAILIELSLPLWAGRAFKITHDDYLRAVPIAVPVQFFIVALLLYTVASNFSRMDRLSARRIGVYELAMWTTLAIPVFAATLAASLMIGDSGNLGALAPVKALMGLWGIGLIATALIDRRVAGVIPIAGILLPMVLSPAAIPGVEFWGFVIEPETSPAAWLTACVLLVLGVASHTRWTERHRR